MLANYSWVWSMPQRMADKHSDTSLDKTHILFAGMYQLKLISWLKGGNLCLLPHLSSGILSGLMVLCALLESL